MRRSLYSITIHTPLEGSSGSEQSTRLMTFTQPFYDISGIQNRKEQNFLARTFSVIAILRYPTFPYCFYYIAILQLSHFREIFTKCLATSDRMYLENYNFLRFSLTSIGISWWRNFWDHLHPFTTRGRQTVVGTAKYKVFSFLFW